MIVTISATSALGASDGGRFSQDLPSHSTRCASWLNCSTFARYPDLAHELDAVFVMGGALTVPGNTPGGAAEWNFQIDPPAAAAVLHAGAPITLVPLDATRHVPLDRSFYEGIKAAHDTPVARFVFDVLTRQRDQTDSGDYFFWDPLAAAILTDGLATVERRRLKVATKASLSGWTFAVTGGTPVSVAMDVPRARFEQIFLSVLNRPVRP
jgi:pyrimidine-specific ribonucleoside hydrolase